VDAECIGDAGGKRLHDARGVEDDSYGDREYDELYEPNNLASEQEEDGYDTDNPKEQRSKQALKVSNKTGSAERNGGCRGEQVQRHLYSEGK
jgi:hypothetical protein